MNNRSYYTTPLMVIIVVIGLYVFVQTVQTNTFILDVANAQYHQNTNYYASLIQKMNQLQEQQETVEHKETPENLRAIYISSWVAGTKSLRDRLIDFIERSSINAVVIDIKDSTGYVSFPLETPLVTRYKTDSTRITDIAELINELHSKDIYVIGRLTTFQDPLMSKIKPEWMFKDVQKGGVWKDRKGLSFINPNKTEAWKYLVEIARASYAIGFDEINFDYIRYPSDGIIANIDYELDVGQRRTDVMKKFYQYLDTQLREKDVIPISADVFGLVTTAQDDIGIGQYLEDIYPYFDAIAPMVYPSHYGKGSFGYPNPNAEPYGVVYAAMNGAKERAIAIGESPQKLRAWIQDFNISTPHYGVKEIQKQIQATRDVGLTSFMSWDPKNRYTMEAY